MKSRKQPNAPSDKHQSGRSEAHSPQPSTSGHSSAFANNANINNNSSREKTPTLANNNSSQDHNFRTPINPGVTSNAQSNNLTTPTGTAYYHPVKDRIFKNQLFYKLGKHSPTSPAESNSSALGPSPIANSTRLGSTAKSVMNQLSNYRAGNQLPSDLVDSAVLRKAYNMNIAKKRNHPNFTQKKNSKDIPWTPPTSGGYWQRDISPTRKPNERGVASGNSKKPPNSNTTENSSAEKSQNVIQKGNKTSKKLYPKACSRNKSVINITVPIHGFLLCTENKCNEIIKASTLHSARKYLFQHLTDRHRIHNPEIQYWCYKCKNLIEGRIPSHKCFEMESYYSVDQSEVDLPSKCPHCDFSFRTNNELYKHKNKAHKNKDRSEAAPEPETLSPVHAASTSGIDSSISITENSASSTIDNCNVIATTGSPPLNSKVTGTSGSPPMNSRDTSTPVTTKQSQDQNSKIVRASEIVSFAKNNVTYATILTNKATPTTENLSPNKTENTNSATPTSITQNETLGAKEHISTPSRPVTATSPAIRDSSTPMSAPEGSQENGSPELNSSVYDDDFPHLIQYPGVMIYSQTSNPSHDSASDTTPTSPINLSPIRNDQIIENKQNLTNTTTPPTKPEFLLVRGTEANSSAPPTEISEIATNSAENKTNEGDVTPPTYVQDNSVHDSNTDIASASPNEHNGGNTAYNDNDQPNLLSHSIAPPTTDEFTEIQPDSPNISRNQTNDNDILNLDVSDSSLNSSGLSPARQQINDTPVIPRPSKIRRKDVIGVGSFPHITNTVGNLLNIVLPILNTIKCPMDGCDLEYGGENFTSAKASIIRHIEGIHHKKVKRVQRWCTFCQVSIHRNITHHGCFKFTDYFVKDKELKYKCKKCNFSCPSSSGISSHFRKHKREATIDFHRKAPPPPDSYSSQTPRAFNNYPTEENTPLSSQQRSTQSTDVDINRLSQVEDNNDAEFMIESADREDGPDDHFPNTRLPHPDAPNPSTDFIDKFSTLNSEFSADKWNDFEECLDKYIQFSQEYVKIKKPKNNSQNSSNKIDIKDPSSVQRLYRRNRRRAAREILNGSSSACNVSHAKLKEKFYDENNIPFDESIYTPGTSLPEPPDYAPITASEVRNKIKKCENTAPGHDRLTYNHWKGVDPDCRALAQIFNICMKAKKIPSSWKTSTTIFIPKDGDPNEAENWRPIALSCTLYKLFTSIISSRLSKWLEEHELLSPHQKGFRPFDGTLENNYLLSYRIKQAKRKKKELFILLIDIKNAFGSIPHRIITAALNAIGVGNDYCDLISDIYSELKTHLLTAEGLSDLVDILCGVKQGCALSSLLFILALDPLLKRLQRNRDSIHTLSYADDMGVIEDNLQDLMDSIQALVDCAARIGLSINPKKCFSLHIAADHQHTIPTEIKINDTPINILDDLNVTKYLGKPFGFVTIPDSNKLEDYIQTGKDILNSSMAPWQKLDALKTFIYPSFQFSMRMNIFNKTEWHYLDNALRPLIKRELKLPVNATTDYLYGDTKDGLFGIPLTADDSEIAKIDTAYKLLTSPDESVAKIAWEELQLVTSTRCVGPASINDVAEFLSGCGMDGSASDGLSTWSIAREASRRLGVSWSFTDDNITLYVGEQIITNRRFIFKSIRAHLRSLKAISLRGRVRQGCTFPCFSADKASTHFHRTGDFLRFTDWRFIHAARLKALNQLKGYKPTGEGVDHSCRLCKKHRETLPHVINHCNPLLHRGTHRHNLIVNRIKEASKRHWNLLSENQMVTGTRLKPDLILEKNGHLLILDVTCPFEDGADAFKDARSIKREKYKPLLKHFGSHYKSIQIEAIIVGSLGSWDPKNDRILLRLCSKKYLNLMKKLIVSETIKCSHDIFYEFLYDFAPGTNNRQRRRNRFRNASQDQNTEALPEIAPLGSSAQEIANDLSSVRQLSINEIVAIDNLVVVNTFTPEPAVENSTSGIMDSSLNDSPSHNGNIFSSPEVPTSECLPVENSTPCQDALSQFNYSSSQIGTSTPFEEYFDNYESRSAIENSNSSMDSSVHLNQINDNLNECIPNSQELFSSQESTNAYFGLISNSQAAKPSRIPRLINSSQAPPTTSPTSLYQGVCTSVVNKYFDESETVNSVPDINNSASVNINNANCSNNVVLCSPPPPTSICDSVVPNFNIEFDVSPCNNLSSPVLINANSSSCNTANNLNCLTTSGSDRPDDDAHVEDSASGSSTHLSVVNSMCSSSTNNTNPSSDINQSTNSSPLFPNVHVVYNNSQSRISSSSIEREIILGMNRTYNSSLPANIGDASTSTAPIRRHSSRLSNTNINIVGVTDSHNISNSVGNDCANGCVCGLCAPLSNVYPV